MRQDYIELKKERAKRERNQRIMSWFALFFVSFIFGMLFLSPAHAQSQCMTADKFKEFTEEYELQPLVKIDTERGTIHIWMDDEGDGAIFLNRGNMACYMGQGEVMFRIPQFDKKDL